MTRTDFEQCINVLRERADALLTGRRAAYATDEDVLDNFRALADASGLPMGQVWLVLAEKGRRALHKIMRGEEAPGEPPLDRFADALNYILLGWAIWQAPAAVRKQLHDTTTSYYALKPDTVRVHTFPPDWPYSDTPMTPFPPGARERLGPGRGYQRGAKNRVVD